jgi:GNAT superfamily N-acetyltransferase
MTRDAEKQETRVRVRSALPDEGELMREIARASKAYWGYEQDRVDSWVDGLDLSPAGLRGKEFYVAEVDGRVVGWSAIIAQGEVCWLDDLWIGPAYIGHGLGTMLFRHVVARGRALGAARIEVEAERHSVGFYEKMGARYVRDSEPGVWGRISPVMALEIGGKGDAA